MNKQTIITILLAVATITANAQTEGNDKKTLSGNDAAVGTMNFSDQMLTDTMRFNVEALQPGLLPRTTDNPRPGTELKEQYTMQGTKPFVLWQGGLLSINGATVDMPGMMGFETGVVALHQDFGRLHLTASAIANKYWMPMQGTLATQYGIGGNVSFEVSEHLSLHAFGYYYNINPTVGPALSPYISTTAYGGYADIRFSDHAGSNVGIRRYLNPMSGRWTTEPIVTPYFRISKKMKLELPVGGLLKAAIWGDRDNPLRFQPRPMPTPQQKQ